MNLLLVVMVFIISIIIISYHLIVKLDQQIVMNEYMDYDEIVEGFNTSTLLSQLRNS